MPWECEDVNEIQRDEQHMKKRKEAKVQTVTHILEQGWVGEQTSEGKSVGKKATVVCAYRLYLVRMSNC